MAQARFANQSWSRTLIAALRRWWFIPLGLCLMGGLTGALAARSMAASATSQVSVQLVGGAGDSTLVTQVVATAMERIDQRSVYEAAAKARGLEVADLRARTTVAEVGESTILDITVADPSPEKAAQDANAVAAAAIASSQKDLAASLGDLTTRSDGLITGGKLASAEIEKARELAVANSLGAAQSNLVSQFGTLTQVEPAVADDTSRPSPASIGLLGALGGLLLGLGVALALGARGGNARTISEVRQAAPRARVVDATRRAAIMRVEAAFYRVLVLAPMRNDPEHQALVNAIREDLGHSGYTLHDGDLTDVHNAPQFDSPRSLAVVEEVASPELINLATSSPDAVCLVVARLGHDRLDEITTLDEAAHRAYHVAVEG